MREATSEVETEKAELYDYSICIITWYGYFSEQKIRCQVECDKVSGRIFWNEALREVGECAIKCCGFDGGFEFSKGNISNNQSHIIGTITTSLVDPGTLR